MGDLVDKEKFSDLGFPRSENFPEDANWIGILKFGPFFCKIKYLYTINNLCVVIEIIASYFPSGLKMMPRNTLSVPQPDSASYPV